MEYFSGGAPWAVGWLGSIRTSASVMSSGTRIPSPQSGPTRPTSTRPDEYRGPARVFGCDAGGDCAGVFGAMAQVGSGRSRSKSANLEEVTTWLLFQR
jgi:hypothetical protein